jgi:hypothetical protein
MEYATRYEHELAGMPRDDLRKLARAAKVADVNKLTKDGLIKALADKRAQANAESIADTIKERYPDQFGIDDSTPKRHLDTLGAVMGIAPAPQPAAQPEPQPEPQPATQLTDFGNGKRSSAQQRTITVLVAANPKRPGSATHARFELYRTGMTVAEFLAAGGRSVDLAWDEGHGFIRLGR